MAAVALLTPWILSAFDFHGNHFVIAVPDGWTALPKEELEEITAQAREATPGSNPQPYDYGFQAPDGSRYPRVLIQVKTGGRLPEKALEGAAPRGEDIQQRLESTHPRLAALQPRVGETVFDPERRILLLRMRFTGPDGQSVQAISGVHPTEAGSIQVHCYAPDGEFERYSAIFSEIIASVRVDEEWKYRPRNAWTRVWDDIGPSIVPAVGGIAAVLVFNLLRRRKLRGAESASRTR